MEITLLNFIGQLKLKKQLELFIYPKLKEKKFCDHILLEGAPGTGKTTLASIITKDNNLVFKKLISPIIKSKADLISVFCDIEEGTVIFFDEIHRLDIAIEEMLYQIMDEQKLNIIIGKDGESNFVTLDIPKFTIIGATTLSGLLSKPLKDRFSFRLHMEDYKQSEIMKIIENNLNEPLGREILTKIAKNSKNTPRIAINITQRVNDYRDYLGKNLVIEDIDVIFDLIGYKMGLDLQDLNYLKLLQKHGSLSINSLSTKMSMEKINIISDVEPHLIKEDLIEMTTKGRNITQTGSKLLKEIS